MRHRLACLRQYSPTVSTPASISTILPLSPLSPMAVLPPAYVDVPAALASRGFACVIGIVVDVLPLFKTGGTSACITFTIKDCDLDNGHTWDGLKIRYFNNNENYLPQIQLKDVVLLRKINVCSQFCPARDIKYPNARRFGRSMAVLQLLPDSRRPFRGLSSVLSWIPRRLCLQ